MITPQLRELIDSANNNREEPFEYKDGHRAYLTANTTTITITTDSPKLARSLARTISEILSNVDNQKR